MSASPIRRVVLPRAEPRHRSHSSALHGPRSTGVWLFCENDAAYKVVFVHLAKIHGVPCTPQEKSKASKTAEFDESVLLDGHLSVALGKLLTRYTAGKKAETPSGGRSGAKYAVDLAKWTQTSGSERSSDSSLLGSSRRSVVGCAGEPNVDGNSKTRKMAREARSAAQGNLEAVDNHEKVRILVRSRMPRLLSGAHPPPPPVSTRLVQPHMISVSRFHSKLHGTFKHAQ